MLYLRASCVVHRILVAAADVNVKRVHCAYLLGILSDHTFIGLDAPMTTRPILGFEMAISSTPEELGALLFVETLNTARSFVQLLQMQCYLTMCPTIFSFLLWCDGKMAVIRFSVATCCLHILDADRILGVIGLNH